MRPRLITIICIILFIAAGFNLISIVASLFTLSLGRNLWIIITSCAAFISIVGLWKMKRWGVYLYLGSYLVGVVMFYIFPPKGGDALNNPILLIVVPLIYSAIVLPYWKRLS